MFRYIRESWEMATPFSKKAAAFFLLVSIILILVTVWVSRNWQGDTSETAEELVKSNYEEIRSTIQEVEAMEDEPLILPLGIAEKSVLERHFAALGGIKTVSSVSSLRFSGTVTFEDGQTQEVIVIKKGGDRMRISVRSKASQTSVCLSPGDNWKAVWHYGNLKQVDDLSAEEIESHSDYIYAVTELFLAMEKGWQLSYLGQRDFNYKMAHVFEIRPKARHTVRFFIDPETYLDSGREDRVFESDGTLVITRRLNYDHFHANDMVVPGRVESYVNGKLLQTMVIEQAQINSGVLDSVFQRPVADPTQ